MAPTTLRVCHSSVASPQPTKTVLVRDDLDENPVAHPGVANVRFDVLDLHMSLERRRAAG